MLQNRYIWPTYAPTTDRDGDDTYSSNQAHVKTHLQMDHKCRVVFLRCDFLTNDSETAV